MEWWERLGYDSADEAFAAGESPPSSTTSQIEDETAYIKSRTQTPRNVETLTDLEKETQYIENYIAERQANADAGSGAEPSVIVSGGEITKYIIVQGPDGRYVAKADPNGTYTDENVQAEIDRLNAQRDENILN